MATNGRIIGKSTMIVMAIFCCVMMILGNLSGEKLIAYLFTIIFGIAFLGFFITLAKGPKWYR